MKNQYFGDVNDYLKYGLLRCIVESGFQVGVCWMLTPDDGRGDGHKTKYLEKPKSWKGYDPQLFEALSHALSQPNGRDIHHAEHGGILPGARFFSEEVPDDETQRGVWFSRAMEALEGTDLLFFDPDNGIEVPSKPYGRKDSSKYVYWSEMEKAWGTCASLLIFQHFVRVKRDEYILQLTQELMKRTSGAAVFPMRTSNVLFLLACREDHKVRIGNVHSLLKTRWLGRIQSDKATQL